MSGGSYDYLCFKDSNNIFNCDEQIERMANRLAGLGYADDAAKETTAMLLEICQARIRIETHISRLRGLWQDIEWWDSCDCGEDQVKSALAKYRGEK